MKNWYALRLTLDISASETVKFLQKTYGVKTDIISGFEISRKNEKKGQKHTHSVISSSLKLDTVRNKLKADLGIRFRKDKLGNKLYSFKQCDENLAKAISYAIKEDDYSYSPDFDLSLLNQALVIRSTYSNPKDLRADLKNVNDEFLEGKLSNHAYLESILAVYAKYGAGFKIYQIRDKWLQLANQINKEIPYVPYLDSTPSPPRTVREGIIRSIIRGIYNE